jgi:hypothetical protein
MSLGFCFSKIIILNFVFVLLVILFILIFDGGDQRCSSNIAKRNTVIKSINISSYLNYL